MIPFGALGHVRRIVIGKPSGYNRPMTQIRIIALARLVVLLIVAPSVMAGTSIRYEVSFPNAAHHEATIAAVFDGLVPGEPLTLRFSRSSPGRYALHEFGRNVYSLSAVDGRGRSLTVDRPSPYEWVVRGHDGTVRVSYTLFGAHADGTYSYIGTQFVHLNAPASFVWSPELESRSIEIALDRPDETWTIATQLFPTDDPESFTAPNWSYFFDSPIHIGPIEWRQWQVNEPSGSYTIRLAVDHAGTPEQVDDYAEMAKKVVAEQIAMWGDIPEFEPGTYTFIATYLPSVDGDGMEHRNSTILTSTRKLETESETILRTLSHEFFHAWNVERLRPASLEPFDLTRANMSEELWFAEGFTSYYAPLFLRRAEVSDDEEFAEELTSFVDGIVNTPARRYRSPVDASRMAPFVDAATAVDPDNYRNTFFSYYPWGAALALGLDLTLRTEYELTLDDLMRAMWERFGRDETPYDNGDIQSVLAELTTPELATEFFSRFIEGREAPDYARLLEKAGFVVRKKNAGRSWLGATVVDRDGKVIVDDRALLGSPFYEAGIEEGDVIVEIDERPVTGASYLQAIADHVGPGTTMQVQIDRYGELIQTEVTLAEDPELEVVTFESAGLQLTGPQRELRASWIGSRGN